MEKRGGKMGNHQYLCTITTINANTPLQYTTSVYPTQILLLTWQASNPCCPSGFRKSAHPPWHTPRLQYSECEKLRITNTTRKSQQHHTDLPSLLPLPLFLCHLLSSLLGLLSAWCEPVATAREPTITVYTHITENFKQDTLHTHTHTHVYFTPILLC